MELEVEVDASRKTVLSKHCALETTVQPQDATSTSSLVMWLYLISFACLLPFCFLLLSIFRSLPIVLFLPAKLPVKWQDYHRMSVEFSI